jgi:hypothetical protein
MAARRAEPGNDRTETPIGREDQNALSELRWHWDTAHHIQFDGDTRSASPLSDAATFMTAESATDLRGLMRADCQRQAAEPA